MKFKRRRSVEIVIVLLFNIAGLAFSANAQVNLPGNISVNKDSHDFGDILEGSNRVADFVLTNNGTEEVFMLRADVPENLVYRYSTQKILPGQTAIIRIKYNPDSKGNFHESVNLYTSASGKPFKLFVSGNVKYIDKSDDPSCPDFNDAVEDKQVTQDFTVQVIDKATMKPINRARVTYEPNPNLVPIHLTSHEGIVKNNLPVDLYDIDVNANGYEPSSQTIYVGKGITSTIFLLEKIPQPKDSVIFVQRDETDQKIPGQDKIPEQDPVIQKKPEPKQPDTASHKPGTPIKDEIKNTINQVFKPKPKEPVKEPDIKKDSVVVIKEKPGELPVISYAPNNIVFLLDVSSSMATPERLPLVKIAMKNLVYSLREIDRVCIVTYASGTKVVLVSTSADNKELIISKIDGLVAHGTTEGGKGIREAYKIAGENFIKGGNNQIILATDGDFNLDRSDDALLRFIRHKSESGIDISVIGVANIRPAIKKMQEIASEGKGNFIHITNKDEANNILVEEIKARSIKK